MKLRHSFVFFVAAVLGLKAMAGEAPLMLTYDKPSQKWMGALPLGNGRLGAMVYGGVDRETIALNEVTLWSGQPDPEANNLCGPEKLCEIREAFLSGDYQRGNELGWQNLCGHGKSFGICRLEIYKSLKSKPHNPPNDQTTNQPLVTLVVFLLARRWLRLVISRKACATSASTSPLILLRCWW